MKNCKNGKIYKRNKENVKNKLSVNKREINFQTAKKFPTAKLKIKNNLLKQFFQDI